jgi:hypothetical protein
MVITGIGSHIPDDVTMVANDRGPICICIEYDTFIPYPILEDGSSPSYLPQELNMNPLYTGLLPW